MRLLSQNLIMPNLPSHLIQNMGKGDACAAPRTYRVMTVGAVRRNTPISSAPAFFEDLTQSKDTFAIGTVIFISTSILKQ